jgi:hypothetical protein
MTTKIQTALLYPLILIFSSFLKGKKTDYKKFFISDKKEFKQNKVLEIVSKEISFYEEIQHFFNKQSPIYDKTFISFELDINTPPEEKKYFAFDFLRVLKIFHTMSMLSAKIPNDNINVGLTFKKQKLDDSQINHLIRYALLTFSSKRVDTLYIDKKILQDDKSQLAYDTMISYINNSTIVNFSNAKNLYVLTCKKGKNTFDIIWASDSSIELTEFNKVYDKYGNLLTKDIKITNSPIYAVHK